MHPRACQRRLCSAATAACLAAAIVAPLLSVGCITMKPEKVVPTYAELPEKQVPTFLKGTVIAVADLGNTEPAPVSGYGLVANLDGTGDSTAPNAVRDYMEKEMLKHRFGSETLPGMSDVTPQRILRDPRFAIVRVDGFLPPGIRRGEHFDVHVSALPESTTSSLARGTLYQTELKINGANPLNPGGSVNVYARSQGPLFVNPAYAFERNPESPDARRALRRAVVMDGGVSTTDRPLMLRLRKPQFSLARQIEQRIDYYFQEGGDPIGAAQDEAMIYCYVPPKYAGDWERFAGVVSHLYLDNTPGFVSAKSKELAAEAVKPDAPLGDITFCWEALGAGALPHMQHLLTHEKPEVAYAAARAALFLGDPAAPQALAQMARTPGHPFRINAVQTLGSAPNSHAINEALRPLLDSDETLVRLAAYEVLAKHKDATVFRKVIREKFVLDIVRSSGPPLIYCSRQGIPRIALIGDRAGIATPIVFAAMGGRLTVSSADDGQALTVFYRPPLPPGGADAIRSQKTMEQLKPVRIVSRPDLAELVARLAGEGEEGTYARGLSFNYAEIVSILNAMSEGQKLTAATRAGGQVPAAFVLQETGGLQDALFNAPPIPEGRPQADEPEKVGLAK